MTYDSIIIGGGAAGLFCAIAGGNRRRRTIVLEHNAEIGRKIVISGGGRCNFTNINTTAENFVSENPHFVRSALAGYTPRDFVELVKRHRIQFFEKKLGQLFCLGSSRQIVDMLLAECRRARVEVITGCDVKAVSQLPEDNGTPDGARFSVETSGGNIRGRSLVVASGGLSFSKIGASDLGYRIARQFGLKIVPTRPSLVALTIKGGGMGNLAGVAVDSAVTTGKQSFRENMLFTHRGMSGPAILQISNYWRRDSAVTIDLLPGVDAADLISADRHSRRTVANYLGEVLPQRLAEGITANGFAGKRLDQLSNREIAQIGAMLNDWRVEFAGTEGYDRAEVTLGGVSTAELSSKTMEAKWVPGLYFIGEVVDVTGWLGGYNFQWAWSSGFAAGQAV